MMMKWDVLDMPCPIPHLAIQQNSDKPTNYHKPNTGQASNLLGEPSQLAFPSLFSLKNQAHFNRIVITRSSTYSISEDIIQKLLETASKHFN